MSILHQFTPRKKERTAREGSRCYFVIMPNGKINEQIQMNERTFKDKIRKKTAHIT